MPLNWTASDYVDNKDLIRSLYTDIFSVWDHKDNTKDESDLEITTVIYLALLHGYTSYIKLCLDYADGIISLPETDDALTCREILSVAIIVTACNLEAKGIPVPWDRMKNTV